MSIKPIMPVKVYIVAGLKSVGKSTVIKSISKRSREGVVKLQTTKNGNIDTFFKVMSLQEADIRATCVPMYIKMKIKSKPSYAAVLVALRTDPLNIMPNNLPIADCYICEFVNTLKWQIEGVAELGGGNALQAYCQQHNYRYQSFNKVPQKALNTLCANVKTFLI